MVSSDFAGKTHLLTDSQSEAASLGPPRWENRSQAVTDRCLPHAYERWQRMLMLFGGPINEALSPGNPAQSFFFFCVVCVSKCVVLFVIVFIVLFLPLVCWPSYCHHSTGYGECLLDEPAGRTYELPTLLPGQIYNANRQCELMFGPGSQLCPYMVGPPTDVLVESWDCWLIWNLTRFHRTAHRTTHYTCIMPTVFRGMQCAALSFFFR